LRLQGAATPSSGSTVHWIDKLLCTRFIGTAEQLPIFRSVTSGPLAARHLTATRVLGSYRE